MNWLDWINDLHRWKSAGRLFLVCFWLAVVATAESVLTESPSLLARTEALDRHAFGLIAVVGVISLFGAVLLWLGMFTHCMWGSSRGTTSKLLWAVCFFTGIWLTAAVYYLVSYPKSKAAIARP
jgi:hypothetical protein